MAAANYKLDNLVVIVDRNGLQISGPTENVMALEPLSDKFKSFGYSIREVDGHDLTELIRAFRAVPFEKGKPSLIIAHTIKGKGVSFMENQAKWHHGVPSPDQMSEALRELDSERKSYA